MQRIVLNQLSLILRSAFFVSLVLSMSPVRGQEAETETETNQPWRLSRWLALPDWIEVSGTHRVRYETVGDQFRALRSGGDQILVFRTTFKTELSLNNFSLVSEILDARQEWADIGTPLNSGIVNSFELLQGYASLRFDVPFLSDSKSELRIGRQSMDVGSRRLLARNRFRNTMNAFNGMHWRWQTSGGKSLQILYFLPVFRRPFLPRELLHNRTRFDDENFDLQFWGLYAEIPNFALNATLEAYVFGLHEDDAPDRPTRNRNLYTPGLRLLRSPAQGAIDFDFESALQLGTSRATILAVDRSDLDHTARLHHAQIGYTLDTPWTPRVAFQYDYASGDRSPTDDQTNRFDTLFGARRFEYGPSGIYGALARSNINSPGYRVNVRPRPNLEVLFAHRLVWLASDTDAWTTGRVRDPTGRSGSFIGNQIEGRFRWDSFPSNFRLEIGGVHLRGGGFLNRAALATGQGNTTYAYLQMTFQF